AMHTRYGHKARETRPREGASGLVSGLRVATWARGCGRGGEAPDAPCVSWGPRVVCAASISIMGRSAAAAWGGAVQEARHACLGGGRGAVVVPAGAAWNVGAGSGGVAGARVGAAAVEAERGTASRDGRVRGRQCRLDGREGSRAKSAAGRQADGLDLVGPS